jgi:hypothetical protein
VYNRSESVTSLRQREAGSNERIRREVQGSHSWRTFLFRSDVISGLSADHERLADGSVLNSSGIRFRELKTFLVQSAERVKRHAMIIAEQEGRPYMYLHEKVRKEDLAKQIAERDHIEQGRICILSVLEPCRTFSFGSKNSKPFVASAAASVCSYIFILSIAISG